MTKNQVIEKVKKLLKPTLLTFDDTSFDVQFVQDLTRDKYFDILDIGLYAEIVQGGFNLLSKIHKEEVGTSPFMHWKSAHPNHMKRVLIFA